MRNESFNAKSKKASLKIASFFMAILMVLCLFPVTAVAADKIELLWPVWNYKIVNGVPTITDCIISDKSKIENIITTHYGTDYSMERYHYGIDIFMSGIGGKAVVAVADGTIYDYFVDDESVGNSIIIKHSNNVYTQYMHMQSSINGESWSSYAKKLKANGVKKGDVIGLVGTTGWSTDNHLDFRVCIGGYTSQGSRDLYTYYPDGTILESYEKYAGYLVNPLDYSKINYSFEYEESPTEYFMTYEAVYDKTARKSAYDASDSTRTVHKGEIVNVVGYVYNSYGNLWFYTDKGDYVTYKSLRAINFNEIPLSNYWSATLKVECNTKNVKDGPYDSKETVKTYSKGDTFDVVAYFYNELGNMWYETSDGYYVFCGSLTVVSTDSYIPANYAEATMEIMSDSKSLREGPYDARDEVRSLKKGDTVNVVSYLYNKYGNLWYRTAEDYYINSTNLKQKTTNSKIPISYDAEKTLVASSSTEIRKNVYTNSTVKSTVSKGETVTVIGWVKNLYGDEWYILKDGYVCKSDLSSVTYTITYNANGGIGGPASQTKEKGVGLTLSSSVPTRSGYTFKGWQAPSTTAKSEWSTTKPTSGSYETGYKFFTWGCECKDGKNPEIGGGPNYDDDDYTFAVRMTKEGAIDYIKSNPKTFGTYSPSLVRYFWKIESTKKGEPDDDGDWAYTVGENSHVDVDFICLDGTVGTRSIWKTTFWFESEVYRQDVTVPGKIYQPGETYSGDANITLTAVWEENIAPQTYTITYNANGGSGAPAPQTKTEGVSLTLSSTVPTLNGYTFLNWKDSDGATYAPGASYTKDKANVLTAVWELEKEDEEIDENAPHIVISNAKGKPGNTVEIPFVFNNNPGFAGGEMEILYDKNDLKLTEITLGTLPSNTEYNVSTGKIAFGSSSNITESGALFTAKFEILASEDKRCGIELDIAELYNAADEDITVPIVDGEVEIYNYIIGDANDDGKISSRDATRILQYIVGNVGAGEINLAAADFNGDGNVTSRDATAILKYIVNQ